MNFIHIAGNLGADPETRFTPSGKKVTNLRVATKSRRGKAGEDITIWYRVTIWGEQFDKMVSFLKKGSSVIVHGELHKPEIYVDREGKQNVTLEITAMHVEFSPFGSGKSQQEGQAPGQAASPYAPQQTAPKPTATQGAGSTFDDEVPF
jgi:single-strand DNA-binding protein